jgi:gas vesicle protein
MRDQDDLPYIVIERHSAGLGAFIWGALIGAGAALLLAPRTGAQTQEELRQGVMRARNAAQDRAQAARQTVDRTRGRIEDQIGSVRDQLGNVRERIETRTERAREVIDTGTRRAREEIERRVAEAKEGYRGSDRIIIDESTPRTSGTGRIEIITDTAAEGTEGRPDLG